MSLTKAHNRMIQGAPINILDFGAVGDGVTDDKASIQAAINAAGGLTNSNTVIFPEGNYLLGSSLAITSAHNGLTLQLGNCSITKGFSGTLCSISECVDFSLMGKGVIDGNQSSYTGKGFVLENASHYSHFASNIKFLNFPDTVIEFGADSGFRSIVTSTFRNDVSTPRVIHINGPDTTAMFRVFSDINANGYIQLDGALDTTINSCFITKVVMDSACSITTITGTVLGNSGGAISLDGGACTVVGCRFSANITLEAGMSGCFVGNTQTSPGFTDNTVSGNVLIHHHIPASAFNTLQNSKLSANRVGELTVNSLSGYGDVNLTWTPDLTASVVRFATALTANRTITLSTTGSRDGMTVRVVRTAGDTGGPWTLAVGSTGLSLSANEWGEVMYNGSYWEKTAYGAF